MIYAINSELLTYFNNYDFLNITSRILFIEIVNILKNTKNIPNNPKIIAIDINPEPRSRCSKFCMNFYFNRRHSTLITYLLNNEKGKLSDDF